MSEIPHPRDSYRLEHAEPAEQAFLDGLARGRMHHAWLLTGPEGVGKATFAYRAARRLLDARPDAEFGLLGAAPDDYVSRLVAGQAHPDLLVLERPIANGKLKRDIPVDEVRRAPEFFSKAPASAPYRVAIVDAADELNDSSANALLKTLEEPPERGVLFLVAHAPGRLLATIRSRCRRLAFAPWPLAEAAAFVERRAGVSHQDALALSEMAQGAPGAAWRLAESEALALDAAAARLVSAPGSADLSELQALTDRFRGGEGAERVARFFPRRAARVTEAAAARHSDALAALWSRLAETPDRAEMLNLDRTDALWSAVADLKRAAA